MPKETLNDSDKKFIKQKIENCVDFKPVQSVKQVIEHELMRHLSSEETKESLYSKQLTTDFS